MTGVLHDCVTEAARSGLDDFSGSAVGCVYVPSPGAAPHASEMKRRLGDMLPAYRVPSRWLALDELPLDSRGKVDRVGARSLLEAPAVPADPAPAPAASLRPLEEFQRI